MLFLLALLPRSLRLYQGRAQPPVGDAVEYESLGRSLALGQGYHSEGGHPMVVANGPQPTAFRTPTLPLFVAAHYALLARRAPLAPRVTLVLLNALAVVWLYSALRRRPGGAAGALLAALLWALWPESLVSFYQNDLLLAESLALPLLCLCLWCYQRGRVAGTLAAGALLGVLILLRAFLILLPPLLCLIALLARRRDLAARALAVGALAAALVLPWSVRNLRTFGRVVPLSTQQGVSLWYGWNEDARGSWSANWSREAPFLHLLQRHPELPQLPEPGRSAVFAAAARAAAAQRGVWGNARLLLRKWALYASPRDVTGWHLPLLVGLPLALLGGLATLRRALRDGQRDFGAADQFLLALALTSMLVVGMIFMDQRFRYIALPATLAFISDGILLVRRWIKS